MSQAIDMTGQRFGKLTVVERLAPSPNSKGASWRCVCDCGNEKVVLGIALRRGHYQSCGCARRDNAKMKLQYIKNDPDWKAKRAKKNTDCPHNEGLICKKKECWRCGFNPKVAASRNAKLGVVK